MFRKLAIMLFSLIIILSITACERTQNTDNSKNEVSTSNSEISNSVIMSDEQKSTQSSDANEQKDIYNNAKKQYDNKNYEQADKLFRTIPDYSDSSKYIKEIEKITTYDKAKKLYDNGKLDDALDLFVSIQDYSDSSTYINEINYSKATDLYKNGKFEEAESIFNLISDYKDVKEYQEKIKTETIYKNALSLLDEGKYEEAQRELYTIDNYPDAVTTLIQMRYESYIFSGVKSIKKMIVNPDTFQLFDVKCYRVMNDPDKSEDIINPILIFEFNIKDETGNIVVRYASCNYDETKQEFECSGVCRTLDPSQYNYDNDDEVIESVIAFIVTKMRSDGETVGDFDLNRVKSLVNSNMYESVSILKY